jgi:hypothetical protein
MHDAVDVDAHRVGRLRVRFGAQVYSGSNGEFAWTVFDDYGDDTA